MTAEICRGLATPPVNVEIRGVRPRNTRGELHGLFYPYDPRIRRQPYIVLWMRTAQRHDVVKPKTFVRTLMHEIGHYLDYAHLRLEDSYHTRRILPARIVAGARTVQFLAPLTDAASMPIAIVAMRSQSG